MTEPQIARRCTSCGASIRERAFFCPQCGKPLPPKPDQAGAALDPVRTGDQTPELYGDAAGASAPQPGAESRPSLPNLAAAANPTVPFKAPAQEGGGPVRHTGSGPRNISEDARGVEKWRQISSTVLDEAAYDPSLRFVLVAAVLFILFLVILLVSELIT